MVFPRCDVVMKIFAILAAFLLVAGGAHAQSVSVYNTTPPGAFEVVNEGSEVSLSSHVQVQRLVNGAWQNEHTDLQLSRACDSPQVLDCITLHSGEHVRSQQWSGWSCGNNCSPGCRANSLLTPGTFRFVVVLCSGEESFAGPTFYMERPPRN